VFPVRYELNFIYYLENIQSVKTKPATGNTRGLNLAAVKRTTVHVSRLPL
jgi:hypothetical protein